MWIKKENVIDILDCRNCHRWCYQESYEIKECIKEGFYLEVRSNDKG